MEKELEFNIEILDNIAHQLISPLQTIQGHCENILDGELDPAQQKKRLREVVGHVRMTIVMAQRIKFLYQIVTQDDSGFVPAIETVPFSSLVTQFIDGYNNYLLALGHKNISVHINSDEMNGLGMVKSWSLAAQQVIMNLFDNAAKYAQVNSLVRVTGKRRKGFVDVTFQTRSIVISEEEKDLIFGRGYRADATKRINAGGTGLGLWISRKLMNAMDGEIRCEPGKSGGDNKFIVSWKLADEKNSSSG